MSEKPAHPALGKGGAISGTYEFESGGRKSDVVRSPFEFRCWQ